MYDVIIVGAGPAGMSAALYLRRALKKVLVLEASSYGGQIINTLDIANYPAYKKISGFDFATNLYDQVKELGAEVLFEKVLDINNGRGRKIVITSKNKYYAKSVIIASGLVNRHLNLSKEQEYLGKGISYCATCDGAFYKEKTVAVVGGGNTALEDALYLADLAKKVYLIHRRHEFRADANTIYLLKEKDNVEFIYESEITKLIGDDYLRQIEITDSSGKKSNLQIDGLFIAIGKIPETDYCKSIKKDINGYIIAKENMHTNIKGIFVAGDVRTKSLRQLVTATNDGAVSATEAIKYLNKII